MCFFISCTKKEIQIPTKPTPIVDFTLDSILTSNGEKSLPLDKNGYYHLPLDKTSLQTFNRITGKVLINGKPNTIPSPVNGRLEWISSHYWILDKNTNLFNVYKTYFNQYNGQQTTSLIGGFKAQSNSIIPTINKESYLDFLTGEINTVFAPIYFMNKDTATVFGTFIYTVEVPVDNLFFKIKIDSVKKSIKIICEL